MSKAARTIHLDPDSKLARVLAESDKTRVLLDANGERFRVIGITNDLFAEYDSDTVLTGLQTVDGSLSPAACERRKEMIYRGREEGTRPMTFGSRSNAAFGQ